MNRRRKLAAAVIVVGSLATGASVAALWTSNATGSGQSAALTAQAVTVNAATGTADLYPGFNAGDVFFTLTNTNPYPITFTSMMPGAIASSSPSACPATNVTVSSATGIDLSVGANATSPLRSVADVYRWPQRPQTAARV